MPLAALALAPLLLRAPADRPVLQKGDFLEADVVILSTNKEEELELREREKWTFTVEAAPKDLKEPQEIRLSLSRALIETKLGDAVVPGPPNAVRTTAFVLSPQGELRFRPFAKTALEGRLFRILEGFLPKNGSGVAGRESVEEPASEPDRLPTSIFGRQSLKRAKGFAGFAFSYREEGVKAIGTASLDEVAGLPIYLAFRMTGLTLEGGADKVTTEFTFLVSRAKLRGKELELAKPADSDI